MHERPQGGTEQHTVFEETKDDWSTYSSELKEGQKTELEKRAEPWVWPRGLGCILWVIGNYGKVKSQDTQSQVCTHTHAHTQIERSLQLQH